MNLPPYFYGERVTVLVDVDYLAFDPHEGFRLAQAPTLVPAHTTGIYVDGIYRPVLGFVHLIRVQTSEWRGWCLLRDDEFEVLQ